MSEQFAGKKVFLLNPPSVIVDDLIHAIPAEEYEIYVIRDPRRALRVFERFPGDTRVGILSCNPEPKLVEQYLITIGVQCGFVRLRLGALSANEARGRRRYVRARAAEDARSAWPYASDSRSICSRNSFCRTCS